MAKGDLNLTIVSMGIMLKKQRQLQLVINKGKRIEDFTDEERMEALRINVLGLMGELYEALDETGWKPWATSNHMNHAAFKSELVDAWHFFMNLMIHSNMTAEELLVGYMEKWQINMDRQTNGYDGVSSKCPGCHRAYDDKHVGCYQQISPDDQGKSRNGWCEVYGVVA